jgi:hypothetical protein
MDSEAQARLSQIRAQLGLEGAGAETATPEVEGGAAGSGGGTSA